MEDLRKRTDSLTPPYPSFGEFVRELLNKGMKAKDIAAKISHHDGRPLKEKAINDWASDAKPGTNLQGQITESLGYDFAERAFVEAAQKVGFPPADAPPEIQTIRTSRALKEFLQRLFEQTRKEAFSQFCGFKSASSIGNYVSGSQGLSLESYEKTLRALPQIPSQLSGEVLGVFTPTIRVAEILRECRLKSGQERKTYAKRLGLSYDYFRYLEDLPGRVADGKAKPTGATANRERFEQLCTKLTKERQRLGLVGTAEETEDSEEADELGMPHEEPTPARPGTAYPGDAIQDLQEEVRRLTAGLQQAQGELAELRTAVLGKAPQPEPYESPFFGERAQTHSFQADAQRVRVVRNAVELLCEELGLLAGMTDESIRQYAREQLRQPLFELFTSIHAFDNKNPFSETLRRLGKSWREKFAEELGSQKGGK